jgi:hypothetical protein
MAHLIKFKIRCWAGAGGFELKTLHMGIQILNELNCFLKLQLTVRFILTYKDLYN